jgi:hypothetical protein
MRRTWALLAVVLVSVICSAQTTYLNSRGFTIDKATGALLASATPTGGTYLNSSGLLVDSTGAVVVTLVGGGASATGTGFFHFVSGVADAAAKTVDLTSGDITGNLPVANLNSGTSAGAFTFWRGDATWAKPLGAIINAFCTGTINATNASVNLLWPGPNSATLVCNVTTGTENPMPVSCTAQNLFATASAAGAQTTSGRVTLYKDGSASALTCDLGTLTTCNDTTHTVAFTNTNKWSVRVTTPQASDTTANVRASFQCQ